MLGRRGLRLLALPASLTWLAITGSRLADGARTVACPVIAVAESG